MHDALVVSGGQAIGELDGELDGLDRRHGATALDALSRGFALEQFHHEVRVFALSVEMVVQDPNDGAVSNLVGEIPFTKNPLGELGARGHRERKQFDCRSRAISMRGCVDCGHAAHTEQMIERPLSVEHRADPPGCRVEIARIGGGLVSHAPVSAAPNLECIMARTSVHADLEHVETGLGEAHRPLGGNTGQES